MMVNTHFRVVGKNYNIVSLNLFSQDSCHYGLSEWNKLLFLISTGHTLHFCHDLDQSGHVVVIDLR